MAEFTNETIKTFEDIKLFESLKPLNQRLPESSILDVFENRAKENPNSIAITMLMSGEKNEQPRRITYNELNKSIKRAANLFSSLADTSPGVAYMLPSLIETHITLWGAETAGYAVPINFLLNSESIAELIKASKANILVALGPHPKLDIWEKALEVRKKIPNLQLIRVSPPIETCQKDIINFNTALKSQPDDHLIFGKARCGKEISAYFHTGGTTALPKLVAHTHRGQLVAAFGGASMCGYKSTDILTGTLPLFHVAGTIVGGLSAFMAGVEILIMSPAGLRNPTIVSEFWRIVSDHKVTIIAGVPTALGAVLQIPVGDNNISSVRKGFTGAALLPPAIGKSFKELTGGHLYEILGMTEASGLISIDPLNGPGTEGSVGWALPYTKVDILGLNDDGSLGETCKVGEIGVISINGDHVSPGYLNKEQNSGVFDNKYLNSGDLGYKDANGRIFIAGRAKDLIIRSGHNIDPAMIENAISSHPGVSIAAAVGIPDIYAGELPICFVELLPNFDISEEELLDYSKKLINERPAWPKIIKIIDKIPLTTVGKIFKPQLRCLATKLKVNDLLKTEFNINNANINVNLGGTKGMVVTVSLANSSKDTISKVESILAKFTFESNIIKN